MKSLNDIQTIKITAPAAASAIAKAIMESDYRDEAVCDLTRRIMKALGLKSNSSSFPNSQVEKDPFHYVFGWKKRGIFYVSGGVTWTNPMTKEQAENVAYRQRLPIKTKIKVYRLEEV